MAYRSLLLVKRDEPRLPDYFDARDEVDRITGNGIRRNKMALSGIQIYKMLPKTNCKDCGFPTCLAFAMKLAAKQVELADCPHVSEESKSQLATSAAPPIRLINLKSNGYEVKAGNEVVLFRHEKTFYHKPGIFVRITDDQCRRSRLKPNLRPAEAYKVDYVGLELTLDGFAVESVTDNATAFAAAVKAVSEVSHRPLILMSSRPGRYRCRIGSDNDRNALNLCC